jgi:hypothetical protein
MLEIEYFLHFKRVCLVGSKNPHLITNWGPAAFTQAELEEREKNWKEKKTTE